MGIPNIFIAAYVNNLLGLFQKRIGPKMLDHEGKEVPGNRGYKYEYRLLLLTLPYLHKNKSVSLLQYCVSDILAPQKIFQESVSSSNKNVIDLSK